MLVVAQFEEIASLGLLQETFADRLLPSFREAQLTGSAWVDVSDDTPLLLIWTHDDNPAGSEQSVLEILSRSGLRAVTRHYQALASFFGLPNPNQAHAFCDLQYNGHFVRPDRAVACSAGHGFDKRHNIDVCTHDGGALA